MKKFTNPLLGVRAEGFVLLRQLIVGWFLGFRFSFEPIPGRILVRGRGLLGGVVTVPFGIFGGIYLVGKNSLDCFVERRGLITLRVFRGRFR